MSQSLYEKLLSPEQAATESKEALWLSRLGEEIRDYRTWSADSLAQSEFEDGLYCDDDEAWNWANQEPAELAADDKARLKFPTHYHGGPWRIVLKRLEDGTPAIRIDLGLENAEIQIDGVWISVKKGEEQPLKDLEEPPLQLRIRILGEGSWLIWPR